jgi:hypothetical protein
MVINDLIEDWDTKHEVALPVEKRRVSSGVTYDFMGEWDRLSRQSLNRRRYTNEMHRLACIIHRQLPESYDVFTGFFHYLIGDPFSVGDEWQRGNFDGSLSAFGADEDSLREAARLFVDGERPGLIIERLCYIIDPAGQDAEQATPWSFLRDDKRGSVRATGNLM